MPADQPAPPKEQLYFADGSPVPPPPPRRPPDWLKPAIKPEIVDRALKLYASGWNPARIARELHIAATTVASYARKAGVFREIVRAPRRIGPSKTKPLGPESPTDQRASIARLITEQYPAIQAIAEPEKRCSAIAALARAAASLHGWGSAGRSTPAGDKDERQAARRLAQDS